MSSVYEQIANLPPEKRAVLEMMLQEQGVDLSQMPILPGSGDTSDYPLSFAQQRLWFLDQLEPGSALYNICSPVRLRGNLDTDTLHTSLETIVRRHAVLRTTFYKDGAEPRQKVHDDIPLNFKIIESSDPEKINDLIRDEAAYSFNLEQEAPVRIRLFVFGPTDHLLVVTLHHIVSDNWSTGVLIREFMELYNQSHQGQTPQLTPLKVQYGDFAAWQRKWLSGKTLEREVAYWKEKLEGLPPFLDLPTDFPRPAYQTHNGAAQKRTLEASTVSALRSLADQNDATLFMVLTAVFEVLLYHYSKQDDFAIGTPIANRNRVETEALIGFFINTLVIRADLQDMPTVKTLLQKVRATLLEAYAHQDVPFETLVEKLDPERSMSHSPLFQTMIVLNNAPVDTLKLSGLELELLHAEDTSSKFDLIFNFYEEEDHISTKVEYNTDLFRSDTITRMIDHFQRLACWMAEHADTSIDRARLMSTEEESALLQQLARNERILHSESLLTDLILQQCKVQGTKVALKNAEHNLDYAGLAQSIHAVNTMLAAKNITSGDVVAVMARRHPLTVAAMLGIMARGAVFLPLDPAYPAERLRFMLEDSGTQWILSNDPTSPIELQLVAGRPLEILEIPTTAPEKLPDIARTPEAQAYLIYTSGSTGHPKGVRVNQQAITDHSVDMKNYFELNENDVTLQFAAMNFDAALEQLFSPLLAGATVILRDDDIWAPEIFCDKINELGLTVINPTTAYWNQWCAHLPDKDHTGCPSLRLVISGGDAMQPAALEKWRHSSLSKVRLINAYGPTETVITASCYDVPSDAQALKAYYTLPIGTVNANRHAYILDASGHLAPQGIPGELCIGGTNVAMGYHNRPEEEARVFVNDPFHKGRRMYRTGDKARLAADGMLEFLGRIDQQVKIRGFRVEPGEIESILAGHPDLSAVAVAVKEDALGEKQLVGYFIPKAGSQPAIHDLRAFMQSQLPAYMVPAAFIQMDTFPTLPGGKINRRALPVPEDLRSQLSAEYVAPRTETEEQLAAIVANVLRIEKVGIHDNFFELGGHSMLGTQVMSTIRETFGVEIPLRALFESPTVEGIALAITEALAAGMDNEELAGMLDELDDLSDDELNAMLNEE